MGLKLNGRYISLILAVQIVPGYPLPPQRRGLLRVCARCCAAAGRGLSSAGRAVQLQCPCVPSPSGAWPGSHGHPGEAISPTPYFVLFRPSQAVVLGFVTVIFNRVPLPSAISKDARGCRYWDDFHACTLTALTDCQEGARDLWEKLRRESKNLDFQGSLFELCGGGSGAAPSLLPPALPLLLAALWAALVTWLPF
ncbi:neuritin 1 [Columba livia]|uniref:Neuritin 1 n=8 Tax=Neoaves TaxID=3078114 RepID=A0A2I0MWR8_COLLI|nr:neuritin 1 [Columba livia]